MVRCSTQSDSFLRTAQVTSIGRDSKEESRLKVSLTRKDEWEGHFHVKNTKKSMSVSRDKPRV